MVPVAQKSPFWTFFILILAIYSVLCDHRRSQELRLFGPISSSTWQVTKIQPEWILFTKILGLVQKSSIFFMGTPHMNHA